MGVWGSSNVAVGAGRRFNSKGRIGRVQGDVRAGDGAMLRIVDDAVKVSEDGRLRRCDE